MTSPGDVSVNVDRLHQHATQRRMQAADFIRDKPPPVPNDPDDPTTGAAGDLAGDVHGVNQALHGKTQQRADKIDADGHAYSQQDQGAGGQVGALNGGGTRQQAASGLTDVGIGSITNGIFGPIGNMIGAAIQGANQAVSGAEQGFTGILGQGVSGGANLIQGLGKAKADEHIGADLQPGAGGALSGGSKSSHTTPASAHAPLAPPDTGQGPGGGRQDYVHTERQDEQDTAVRPAGMGGGMPMGLGAAGGGGSEPSSTPRTYPVHVPGGKPPPTPVVAQTVYAASPLQKDDHGTDT